MINDNWPLVSIVLLNYNGEKFKNIWRSIFNIDYPNYEIIFVDNGSKDKSFSSFLEISKNYSLTIKSVSLKENIGYSKANNIGISYTNGEYVVLLSNDIEVERNWLANMIKVLNTDKQIAVAQSAMYSLYNKENRDYQCNYIDVLGFCHRPSLLKEVEEVFYSEGAVMFIRKKVIDEVGGLFDSDYFMFDEDIDFCWRVRLKGYKVCVVSSSKVYHARGGTVEGIIMKTNPFYVYLITRNKIATFFKNLDFNNLLKYMPLVLFFNFVKGIWLIHKNKREAGIACFKGITSFLFDLSKNIKKRKISQSLRSVSDDEIFKYVYPLNKSIKNLLESANKISNEWLTN